MKVINFAEKTCQYNKRRKSNAWKYLFHDKSGPQMKKGSCLFDVTMGTYDGAKVYEMVGTFLLYSFFTA